jgi:hypothetical protein
MLVAGGRFRVSADTPDQVELFQGVARRVSDMFKRPVVSYANGRDIVITFGQEEAPALALPAARPGSHVRSARNIYPERACSFSPANCRSRYRWVFPLMVLGSSETNSITLGYLYGAIEDLV